MFGGGRTSSRPETSRAYTDEALQTPQPASPKFQAPKKRQVPGLPNQFVALDCETTGLSADAGHRIVSIALVRADIWGCIDDFLYLVFNPQRRSDPIAEKIHGFNHWHLQHQRCFHEHSDEIVSFIGDRLIVGHNVGFDIQFLRAELRRCGLPFPTNDHYCTMAASEIQWGRRLSLDKAIAQCTSTDLSDLRSECHDALIDACMAAGLFGALVSGESKMTLLQHRPSNEVEPPPLDYVGDMSRSAMIARGKRLTRAEAAAAFAKYESKSLAARALGVSRDRIVRALSEGA